MDNKKLFINLSYDVNYENESGIIKSGLYNKANCGGSCDWTISTNSLPNAMISLPYQNQSRLYVFEFYGSYQYKSTPLYDYMMTHTKTPPIPMEQVDNDDKKNDYAFQFVYLCNRELPDYNHDEECLEGVLTGDIDQDKFGGNVLYSRLT